jgi:hypothetical protein
VSPGSGLKRGTVLAIFINVEDIAKDEFLIETRRNNEK